MKLLFLDADGTLFHPAGYIPQSAFLACQQAQKNGHKIILCTGRQRVEVYGDLEKLDYDGMITGSGAHVQVHDQILLEESFSLEDIHFLEDYLNANHIPAIYESAYGLYGNGETLNKLSELIRKHCSQLTQEEYSKHGLVYILHHLTMCNDVSDKKISKITFMDSFDQVSKDLSNRFDLVRATYAPMGHDSGEISMYGITKAKGMQAIMDYYHCLKEDTIAFGDGFNDLSMFACAGYAVCMGNANRDVQRHANYITKSLEDNGIEYAFRELNLI